MRLVTVADRSRRPERGRLPGPSGGSFPVPSPAPLPPHFRHRSQYRNVLSDLMDRVGLTARADMMPYMLGCSRLAASGDRMVCEDLTTCAGLTTSGGFSACSDLTTRGDLMTLRFDD